MGQAKLRAKSQGASAKEIMRPERPTVRPRRLLPPLGEKAAYIVAYIRALRLEPTLKAGLLYEQAINGSLS
jgi:hypothetical protein